MRAVMVQGTASGVGKSWVAAALCRLAARRGVKVAPFKAQNLSNNAAPALTLDGGWGEIGRAQALQAYACGLTPHVDMNPLLIKPLHQGGAEVIVQGRSTGPLTGLGGEERRALWWRAITESYARLDAELVILEGAGSPAEMNLQATDLVNMRMARHADARVLLVGDIDRGGVFAALLGTLDLLAAEDRARVAGLVVNRFRGDPVLFTAGLRPLADRAGTPVLGVLPFRHDVHLDEEDAATLGGRAGLLDVCALRLPTLANFTDLNALSQTPGVGLRYEAEPERIGRPDLLVIPGSRDTEADLAWMRRLGLDHVVTALAEHTPILGLCGGFQLLGRRLGDSVGLGLLPVTTTYAATKHVRPVASTTPGRWLLPPGLAVVGYEIHLGRTEAVDPLVDGDGAVDGLVAGSYFHGLLDSAEVCLALVNRLRARRGLRPQAEHAAPDPLAQLDAAADTVERHLDLRGIIP